MSRAAGLRAPSDSARFLVLTPRRVEGLAVRAAFSMKIGHRGDCQHPFETVQRPTRAGPRHCRTGSSGNTRSMRCAARWAIRRRSRPRESAGQGTDAIPGGGAKSAAAVLAKFGRLESIPETGAPGRFDAASPALSRRRISGGLTTFSPIPNPINPNSIANLSVTPHEILLSGR